ncbi:MAG: hypothetical protein HFJ35_02145 [Clostridia bacterium]|nr:hypothetical protein [Clostridia bacterium]
MKMEGNSILEMIKSKDSKSALKEMESILKNILLDKLDKEKNINIDFRENDFILLLDFCIKNFTEYYDILTYLRNLYFFSEKSDSEKLYELANIYEIISK